MYQDLSARHDCPVKKGIVDLPIGLKGNTKHISAKLSSPFGTRNKDLSTALHRLLTTIKLSQ